MTQTVVLRDPHTDSVSQLHGKVIQVKPMCIKSYHISNNK